MQECCTLNKKTAHSTRKLVCYSDLLFSVPNFGLTNNKTDSLLKPYFVGMR